MTETLAVVLGYTFLFCFIMFILGLFRPEKSLFWYRKDGRTRLFSIFIYGGVPLIILMIFGMFMPVSYNDNTSYVEQNSTSYIDQNSTSYSDTHETSEPIITPQIEIYHIGDKLITEYFEVTVNRVKLLKSVNTGNTFSNLHKEDGIQYLIINVTFKNIDSESRMMTDGDLFIVYNGKSYTYDQSETVLADGWGTMKQINPLIKFTTRIVYKVPTEISGRVAWMPGRSDKNSCIFLGEIRDQIIYTVDQNTIINP